MTSPYRPPEPARPDALVTPGRVAKRRGGARHRRRRLRARPGARGAAGVLAVVVGTVLVSPSIGWRAVCRAGSRCSSRCRVPRRDCGSGRVPGADRTRSARSGPRQIAARDAPHVPAPPRRRDRRGQVARHPRQRRRVARPPSSSTRSRPPRARSSSSCSPSSSPARATSCDWACAGWCRAVTSRCSTNGGRARRRRCAAGSAASSSRW